MTLEQVKQVFHYNPDTGIFTWLVKNSTNNKFRSSDRKIGRECRSHDVHGYIQINAFGKVMKAHRLAWFYMTGEWPIGQIDHINHIRDDNRWCNFRVVDNHVNHLNRPMQSNNKTGCVGVTFYKRANVYQAHITFKGVRHYLGSYKNLDDAIAVRLKANKDFGFSENHGVGYGRKKYKRYDNKQ